MLAQGGECIREREEDSRNLHLIGFHMAFRKIARMLSDRNPPVLNC
jgi:hypothetical protein